MASGEWRYGQSDPSWSAGATPADPGNPDPPDLWPEVESQSRSGSSGWFPGSAVPPTGRSGPGWPVPPAEPPVWAQTPSGTWSAQPRHAFDNTGLDQFRGDPRWLEASDPPLPPPGAVVTPPRGPASPSVDWPPPPTRTTGATVDRRPFPDRWAATQLESTGRHAVRTGPPSAPSHPTSGYSRVLMLTLAWYGVPTLLAMVWLIAMDSDRRSTGTRELLTNLPWFFSAIVLSIAVAWLLRWASIAWRGWTLTFAAAVIGAGVATIAHSFTL
jgi:hypothetical protein